MEIAQGTICLNEYHRHVNYHITPAEAVILKLMHNKDSKGAPLRELVITGTATEVDDFGKPKLIAVKKTRKVKATLVGAGKKVPMETDEDYEEFVPSEKPRTNDEEINRLQRKYTGNINNKTAFVAAFGDGALVRLPETFEEVKHIIGPCFTDSRTPPEPSVTLTA